MRKLKIKTIDILSTTYKIEHFKHPKDEIGDVGGETDFSKKLITIDPELDDPTYNRTLRHELIHAFQYESGLGFNFEHKPIGVDETMVDWFAIQYPKIKKVFEKLEVEK